MSKKYSDPFYTVTYYIKWVTTSWTHSINTTTNTSFPNTKYNELIRAYCTENNVNTIAQEVLTQFI